MKSDERVCRWYEESAQELLVIEQTVRQPVRAVFKKQGAFVRLTRDPKYLEIEHHESAVVARRDDFELPVIRAN
jgi:hypothetical protein